MNYYLLKKRQCMRLFFAFIAIFTSSGITFAEQEFFSWSYPESNLQITVISPFGSLPFSGYTPLEVTLKNRSSKPINVEFKTNSNSSSDGRYTLGGYSYSSLDKSTIFQLSCPPMQTVKYDLNVPVARAQGSSGYYGSSSMEFSNQLSFNVQLENKYNYGDLQGGFKRKYSNIAYSTSVKKSATKSNGGSKLTDIKNSFEPSNLPTNLKAISGYDFFGIKIADWELFTKAQQRNLMTWVAQGGQLFFISAKKISSNELKDIFNETSLTFKKGNKEIHLSNGKIIILSEKEFYNKFKIEFNAVYKGELESVKNLKENGFELSDWPLQAVFGYKSFGSLLLSIILIAFAIMVAPINFLVFAPKGKRHKLLFTTPIIALGASLLLILYIIFSEGFGGNGMQLVHKELDSKRKKAYITQEQISRTGVLLGNQFQLDNDYQIIQMPLNNSRWARVTTSGKSVSENYTIRSGEDSTTYNGNYYSARSEHAHLIKGTAITQESVTVSKKGDEYTILSTLPHSLETLVFQTSEGTFFKASDIKTGVSVKAKPIDEIARRYFLEETIERFTTPLGRRIERLGARENSFIAFSNDTEGIETLKSIDWKADTVTTGLLTFTNAK